MRRSQSLIGLVGLILLFFGLASFLLLGELGATRSAPRRRHRAARLVPLRELPRPRERADARSTRYGANMIVYSALFLALLVAINWLACATTSGST
jgi:hypothetical protein